MTDRRNGVPSTVTSIPLVDPHAPKADPSIGDLVKDATAQVSTLVRAEVELAKAEITRDVKKGLTGSVFFSSWRWSCCSTRRSFFLLLPRRAARPVAGEVGGYLIVFGLMVAVTLVFAFLGYLKVRRIRGPQKTIASVKEIPEALTPGHDKDRQLTAADNKPASTADPSGW